MSTAPALFAHQVEGVKWLLEHPYGLLGDEMRLGKEVDVETPVLTPGGWSRIGDLRVGDTVYCPDGKLHAVRGVYPQGTCEAFELTLSDGATVTCGAGHLWAVTNANDRRAETTRA